MITVETELLEDRQAKMVVTVDAERVQRAMKDAAQRISKHVNIPGFRKGKAPYRIIAQYYGEEAILEEAIEPLGQAVYKEALEQTGLEPYAPGELSDMATNPLVLTFTVPLAPEIDLGAYREVRLPFEVEEVTKDDVEEALKDIQQQEATLDPVERPVAMGDVAILDIVGTLIRPDTEETETSKSATWLSRKGVRVKIAEDATYPVPGFPARVVGMSQGEERSFDISFAEDDEEVAETLRGKTLHFEVKCDEVYKHTIPELTDEFAREVGDYDGLLAMRAAVRARLEEAAKQSAHDSYAARILEHLLDSVVTVKFPPVMVEEEIDSMIEEMESRLQSQGLSLDEYRRINHLTEDQMRDDLRESARRRLSEALVIAKLSEVERLQVKDEEIEDEIKTMVLSFGSQAALAQQLFGSPEAKRSIMSRLLYQKAIDRLIAIARGEAPEIAAEEVSEFEASTHASEKTGAEAGSEAVAEEKEAEKPAEASDGLDEA